MKKFLPGILLLFFAILPLTDLLHPGLFIAHDSESHVARLASFYQSLSEGNLIPRWAGNLNNGFGTPILMFLYPFPEYLGSLFHFFGASFIDSVKIVFALGFFLSGIFMYLWAKEELGEEGGLVAGIFYIIVPYRFVDIYVRGALGENTAFVFLPLALWSIYKIGQTSKLKYVWITSLGVTGLILSHNALSLMFLPMIVLYIFYKFWLTKQKKIFFFSVVTGVLFGFFLSAFFWIPAFFEGKYTLRDIVISGKGVAGHFSTLKQLIYSPWGYGGSGGPLSGFSMQVGFAQWLVVLLGVVALYLLLRRRQKKTFVFLSAAQVLFWTTLYLMTKNSQPIWEIISILPKFQFPWRLLSLSVFTTAVIGGLVVNIFQHRILTVLLISLVFITNKDYWHAQGYYPYDDNRFIKEYEGTTDTGESSPRWSTRAEEIKPNAHIEVVAGNATIKEMRRLSNLHEYEIKAVIPSKLLENTLYFPGWEVFVNGQKADVEFQDPTHRGKMTFWVPEGDSKIVVKFGETKLRKTSNLISLFAIFLMFIISMLQFKHAEIISRFSHIQRGKKLKKLP